MAGPWEAQPILSMHGPKDDGFGGTANESPGLNWVYRTRRSMLQQSSRYGGEQSMIGQRVHSRIKEAVDLRQGLIHGSINGNCIGRRGGGRGLESVLTGAIYIPELGEEKDCLRLDCLRLTAHRRQILEVPQFPPLLPPQWRWLISSCLSFNCPLLALALAGLSSKSDPVPWHLRFPSLSFSYCFDSFHHPLFSSSSRRPPPQVNSLHPVRSQETPNQPHATLNRFSPHR